MGWSGGAGLFAELIYVVKENVPDDDVRHEIYAHMVDSFIELDWDTLDECLGVDHVYDDIYRDKYPDADSEEESYDED